MKRTIFLQTTLFLTLLLVFSMLFFAQESSDDYVLEEAIKPLKMEPDRFRVGANFGRGFRLAKVPSNLPPEFQSYINELKKGLTFGFDASYLINKSFGFGLKYQCFKSKNNLDNIAVIYPNGLILSGSMSDDISIGFIGASFYNRPFSKNANNNFFVALSLGKLSYVNNAVFVERFKLEGNSFGFVADVGYDILIDKNISLGFLLSWTVGSIREFTLTHRSGSQQVNVSNGEAESLSRIDLSIGLRFHR